MILDDAAICIVASIKSDFVARFSHARNRSRKVAFRRNGGTIPPHPRAARVRTTSIRGTLVRDTNRARSGSARGRRPRSSARTRDCASACSLIGRRLTDARFRTALTTFRERSRSMAPGSYMTSSYIETSQESTREESVYASRKTQRPAPATSCTARAAKTERGRSHARASAPRVSLNSARGRPLRARAANNQ